MINERIRALLRARGWKIIDLVRETNQLDPAKKIHHSQLSRMLRGERQWPISHLELVAKALGVQVGDLVDENVAIPIVAAISAFQESAYPIGVQESQILGYIPLPRTIPGNQEWPRPEDLYGLRVKDNSFEPMLLENTRIIVHKNGEIKEGDLVVYCDHSNRIFIGRLYFHGEQLLLRSPNPAVQTDMILPRRLLSSMDRIIAQIFI
jgi:SOS-response transcriptional repressor LexA